MLEYIRTITFLEIAIYVGGSLIWIALIWWLFVEEREAQKGEAFRKSRGKSA